MPARSIVYWVLLVVTPSLLLLFLNVASGALEQFRVTDATLRAVEERYGRVGRFRVERWQRLLDQHQQSDIHTMLQAVNRFANENVGYASDLEHWGQNDYWATPLETLGTGKGDCEDYVILKYASLRALGVPEERLRLMYVRALSIDEPHMVLIYFEEPDQFPLVLDNLTNRILPANERTDLRPVFSFNGQGLWMARAQGLGQQVPNSPGVRDWTLLLERIERGE